MEDQTSQIIGMAIALVTSLGLGSKYILKIRTKLKKLIIFLDEIEESFDEKSDGGITITPNEIKDIIKAARDLIK